MKNFALLTSVAMIAASPCFANEDKIPPSLQLKYERRLEEMNRFDKNKDGVLQADELQRSVGKKFDAADINNDGVISEEEKGIALGKFVNQGQETYGNAVGKRAKRLENRYNSADANKDGQISKQEYDAYFGDRYESFDRDGDGIITEQEYRTDVEKRPGSYKQN